MVTVVSVDFDTKNLIMVLGGYFAKFLSRPFFDSAPGQNLRCPGVLALAWATTGS